MVPVSLRTHYVVQRHAHFSFHFVAPAFSAKEGQLNLLPHFSSQWGQLKFCLIYLTSPQYFTRLHEPIL